MTPFRVSKLDLPPAEIFVQQLMDDHGLTRIDAYQQYKLIKDDEIFVNDLYQVNIDRNPPNGFHADLIHLSIKRRDKAPIHDWRHLQQIKTMLCGPEAEGLELYPAESRVVDTANQYHIFVVPSGQSVPFGFASRAVSYESKGGVVQRPLETEESNAEI